MDTKEGKTQSDHTAPGKTPLRFSDARARREWVLWQLRMRGLSMAEVARRNDVCRQTLYRVWVTSYPKMEQALAEAIGVSAEALFPERHAYRSERSRQRSESRRRARGGG